jgi:two-component system, OmpR family, sensor histidine kinase KdpD
MQASPRRGRLTIYLGYAAGVGKTYQMLEESQDLARQGRDLVVGYFEPHGRKETIAKTEGLELIPRRRVEYRGSVFEEMDTDAILARKPAICAVDEFPHTNVPGSPRKKRWEDVLVLLEAGIDVLTTMNVQHIESLNDQVFQISGVQVRETVPDWIVKAADEVVMVDLTPRALLNRLERGVVYGPEKAQKALEHFFQESTLAALREFALRQTAHEVEIRQSEAAAHPATGTRDRILIVITPDDSSASVIRRGRRVADYLHADCYAVAADDPAHSDVLEKYLTLARQLHIETRTLPAFDPAEAVVDFARLHQITQIFVGRQKPGCRFGLKRTLVQRIVHLAGDMQVIQVADRRQPTPRRSGSG